MIPSGLSPLSLAAVASIGVAIIGVFLSWIDPAAPSGAESRIGIEESDGLLVIVIAIVGVGAALVAARPAWIAPGLGTAVAVRDATRVADNPTTEVGLGLWITSIGFALATVLLLAELIRTVTSSRRQSG